MDQDTTISSSPEDLSSIETGDADNTVSLSSFPIHQPDAVDLNSHSEQLEKHVEELTKQLNESMDE